MPIYDPTAIPSTSYTNFSQGDAQLNIINSRFKDDAARSNNPRDVQHLKPAPSKGPVSQIYATPAVPKGPPPVPVHKINPVLFYDKMVAYLGEIPYFKCQPVGETGNFVDRPATEKDKERFPNEWSAYLSKKPRADGTLLTVLNYLTSQQIGQLAEANVFTVEQAQFLSDTAIENLRYIGIGPDLPIKASRYLNYAKAQKALDEKDQIIAELKHELDQYKNPKQE